MNYCEKGQMVVKHDTGQIGTVVRVINRRLHNKDGRVMLKCGADGPFIEAEMNQLRECTGNEYKEAIGVK